MLKIKAKKGVALYITIFAILLVIIFAGIILNTISSQSRLTQHQIGRIQADYAAMAGINVALEMLRLGKWDTGTFTLCKSGSGCTLYDADLPPNIDRIEISIGAMDINSPAGTRQVTATTIYSTPNISQ
ncbi:MAG: hypothetical protein MUC39_05310 [Candidatus Omnitrophica bacterium]|jgi:hypothetical protein|nr:hypothetical protein [Candidatus Omnitrophota bacterium]